MYLLQVNFSAALYGQFEQTVVFDFSTLPVVTQCLSVNVTSLNDVADNGDWLRLQSSHDFDRPVLLFEPRFVCHTNRKLILLRAVQRSNYKLDF